MMSHLQNNIHRFFLFLILCICVTTSAFLAKPKPVMYIIGDSTVRNGTGKGGDGLWGWGSIIQDYFDTTRIHIENHAIGGRSSRTFLTEGRWEKILANLKEGDYVLMQFGHNDGGAINDTSRARGSIKGVGEEMVEIDNLLTKKHETVHSYGWYMKKYISEAQSKGAIPIVFSLVPRNVWKEGKVQRGNEDYGKWAAESALASKALFIDLNEIVAQKYEKLGEEKVRAFFPKDHTHPNYEGAKLNAESVVEGIKNTSSGLRKYILK